MSKFQTSEMGDEFIRWSQWYDEQVALLEPHLKEMLHSKPQIRYDFESWDGDECGVIVIRLWYAHDRSINDERPMIDSPCRIARLTVNEVNVIGEIMALLLERFPNFSGEFVRSEQGLLFYELKPKEKT